MGHNVLVTCGGKWVGMTLAIKEAMNHTPGFEQGKLFVADKDVLTPAGCFSDGQFQVPSVADADYIDALVELCAHRNVHVLIPLIDVDVQRLSEHRSSFQSIGTHLVVPGPELTELCLDKAEFQRFCDEALLATPAAVDISELDSAAYPLFFRRRHGFGSIGAGRVDSAVEARSALTAHGELVFNEFVDAPEASVDAYINSDGRCTVLVLRRRDKVVGGEAQRSTTFTDPGVRALALTTVEALAERGLRGPLNVQLLMAASPLLVEVNTRLGSCSVLANAATDGRLIASMLVEGNGGVATGNPDDYLSDFSVYRFTGDVFHQGAVLQRAVPAGRQEVSS